jgi:hypothetical protein
VHRRPLGRPRLLAIAGAVLMIVGCLPILPWYSVGGGADLPLTPATAFGGSGILVFLAGLGVIAVVTLPYATDRPVPLDRATIYLLLVAVAVVGFVLWPFGLLADLSGFLPNRAPGLWVAAIGTLALARAAFEMLSEGPRR